MYFPLVAFQMLFMGHDSCHPLLLFLAGVLNILLCLVQWFVIIRHSTEIFPAEIAQKEPAIWGVKWKQK